MQQVRLRRNARRALARLTRTCAAVLERFAARVEPVGARHDTTVPTDQPPLHWLEDIQQYGGPLDWVRFSARTRAWPTFPPERRQMDDARPHPTTVQPAMEDASASSAHTAVSSRPRFTVRPQPAGTPPSAGPATPSAAEPRLTLRYAPRLAPLLRTADQIQASPAKGELAVRRPRGRPPATDGAEEGQSVVGRPTATPPIALDMHVLDDLFPEWPAPAGSERALGRHPLAADGALPRAEPAILTMPQHWERPAQPAQATQLVRHSTMTDIPGEQTRPVEQPWPTLPDSVLGAASSDQAALELARSRREEQHLRRLEHEQRGAPWNESLS